MLLLAHVRRYFIEAVPKGKKYDYSNPAVKGVSFCNELFKYEDKYKKQGLSYEKQYAMRLEQEKPVLDAFWYLNIYKCLKFLLEQRHNSKMTDEQLSAVLPWNQEVIESCHN